VQGLDRPFKVPKPKWRKALCQKYGCRLHVVPRKPFCRTHLAERLRELAALAPGNHS
jgi:hypothetical protein